MIIERFEWIKLMLLGDNFSATNNLKLEILKWKKRNCAIPTT